MISISVRLLKMLTAFAFIIIRKIKNKKEFQDIDQINNNSNDSI